jgi:hypothetical protein
MSGSLLIAILISEAIACWLAWRILRSPDPLLLRIMNAAIAFIPFFGPLLAYWAANFPAPHHPDHRDNNRYFSDVHDRWISRIRASRRRH